MENDPRTRLRPFAVDIATKRKWIPRTQFRRRMQPDAGTVPLHQVAYASQVGYSLVIACGVTSRLKVPLE